MTRLHSLHWAAQGYHPLSGLYWLAARGLTWALEIYIAKLNYIHLYHLTYYYWHTLGNRVFQVHVLLFHSLKCVTLFFCLREIIVFLHDRDKKEFRNQNEIQCLISVWLKRYLPWWCPRSSSFLGLFGTGMSVSSTSSMSWRPWLTASWWPWPSARWWSRSLRWMRSF